MLCEARRNPSGDLNQERMDRSMNMIEKKSRESFTSKEGAYKKSRESDYGSNNPQTESKIAFSKFNENTIDCFFEIKRKLDEFSLQELKKFIPLDEDRDKLSKTESKKILQYLKQIAVFIINTNQELENELINGENEDIEAKNYEALLQKLEADVRQHIRIEQQLKLYVDSTQSKLDEFEYNKDRSLHSIRLKIKDSEEEQNALEQDLKKKDEELERLKIDLQSREAELKRLAEKKMEIGSKPKKLDFSGSNSLSSKPSYYMKEGNNEPSMNQSFKGTASFVIGNKNKNEGDVFQTKEKLNSTYLESLRIEQKKQNNLSSFLGGMEKSKGKTQSELTRNSSHSKKEKSYECEKDQKDSNLLKTFKRKIEEKKEEISQMNASLRYSAKHQQENNEEFLKSKGRNSDLCLAAKDSKEGFYMKGDKENRNPEVERKEKMLKKARELNKSSVVNRERMERGYDQELKNSSVMYPTKNSYMDNSNGKVSSNERKSFYMSTNSEEDKEEGKETKKYEKLRETMLSPKLKFEVPRSQSVDIYSKMNQRMRRAEAELSLEMGDDDGVE